MPQPANTSQRLAPNRILIGGLILYACAFAVLLRTNSFDATGAVVVLIVFGIAFPLIAWIATRHAIPLSISVKASKSQLIVLIGYIIFLSVYLIGGPQWIDQHLPQSWVDSARIRFFIGLAKKLVVFVVIPFAIFRFGFGYRVRDFGIQREGLRALRGSHLPVVLVVGGAFLCFQYFASSGGAAFRREHFTAFQLFVGLPLCFVLAFRRSRVSRGILFSRSRPITFRCCLQIRSKRRRIDVANLWLGACTWFHFSTCRRS
jgi:hypothetical protein